MIILIGAMSEELIQIKEDLKMEAVANSMINEFKTTDQKIVLAWTGIGLVNAANGLTYLLTKYAGQVEYVINLGTAGAVSTDLTHGEFVIIEKTSFSTADSTGFGYVYGQLPRMPKFYESDNDLVVKLDLILKKLNKKFICGNTASSDIFFQTHEKVETYVKKLPFSAHIAEMECAAFYQTAHLFSVKIAAIKIVSDVIGLPDPNEEQFEHFLPKAAQQLSDVVQQLINWKE